MAGIAALKKVGQVDEAQYKAPRTFDNMAPADVRPLLKIIHNLGFDAPIVTIGNGDAVALRLEQYESLGADLSIPVAVVLVFPNAPGDGHLLGATAYNAFAADLWEGFGQVAAVTHPELKTSELRALAITQMPELDQAFTAQIQLIAQRGL